KRTAYQDKDPLILLERGTQQVLELGGRQFLHPVAEDLLDDHAALLVEHRILERVQRQVNRLLFDGALEVQVTTRPHRQLRRRTHHATVEQRLEVLLDQHLGAITTGAVDHLVHDVAQRHHFRRGDMGKLLRHITLAPQEQALDTEWPDLDRVERTEDHVQRQPVGGDTDDKAEHRQHPVFREKDEYRHLDQAKQETEIETGVGNKAELGLTDLAEDTDQQVLVVTQLGRDHVLEVNQLLDIAADIINQVVHHLGNGATGTVVDALAHHLRQVFPQHGVALGH